MASQVGNLPDSKMKLPQIELLWQVAGLLSDARLRHSIHTTVMIGFLWTIVRTFTSVSTLKMKPHEEYYGFNPWQTYGTFWCSVLYLFRCLVLLALPQVVFNVFGLLYYNPFANKVILLNSSLLTPLICIRVVTRGDFPALIRSNVARNMSTCLDVGMENFLIEVVTDKTIGLPKHHRIREIVVPTAYRPKSGALYKARALQYCLEDETNQLADNDYIVHLDEETLLTRDSVRGILNFVSDGTYDFGQGVITYTNDRIINWFTTLADCIRVADDMGRIRAQLSFFHKPLFGWKGSFIVARVKAEQLTSFDNGPEGSIAEDCFFAMKAYMNGYTFEFVDGEMWEKSPFTLWDFIQQRKRWIQGLTMVVHSSEVKWSYKILLAFSLYSWLTLPLSVSNILFEFLYPLPLPVWLNFTGAFVAAVKIYMYLFGAVKSLRLRRLGFCKYCCCLLGVVFIIVLAVPIENVAVLLGIFGERKKFHVVQKDPDAKNQQNICAVSNV